MPTRRKSNADPAAGQVIDQGPFFRNSSLVMQRRHNAASPQAHSIGYHCQRRGCNRRAGIEAAEGVEMALGCPNSFKPMPIRKLRAFDQ